jgi:hypothetical protein
VSDTALQAEAAWDWLIAHLPAAARDSGLARIDHWRESGTGPALLWRLLLDLARSGGLLDAAITAAGRGLAAAPDDPDLLADLAALLIRTGDDAQAARIIDRLPAGHPARLEPLLAACEAGTMIIGDEVTDGLTARPDWGTSHDRLVKAARQEGAPAKGAAFALGWMGRHGLAPMAMARAGEALLEAGEAAKALQMLMPLWQANEDRLAAMIGPCRPPSVAVTDAIARIEAGLAAPAAPPLPLPGADLEADAASVLYVGASTNGGREVFPNDLADHFRATAAAAGGRLDLWLDDALGKPMEVRAPDTAIAARIDALDAHLGAARPDIVLLDCCWSPTGRGLNRDNVAALKRRHGFRLIALFRDALAAARTLMEYWAEIADAVLLFDPHSPVIPSLPGRCTAIPVPALRPPFAPGTNHGGLLFVGGLAQTHRVMLLAALTQQPIGLSLLIGSERLRRSGTPADYAARLGEAGAVLNVATHDQAECLVTGRVWESIACGAVLLEQAGSGAAAFFTPWRHFLPWHHQGDIVALALALEERDDLRRAVAAEALGFACAHYGPHRVWRAVLAAGLGRHGLESG